MLVLDVLVGIVIGFVLGLIPNLHINTIGYIFSSLGILLFFKDHFYLFFAICVSQTITSIIPAVLVYTQTQDSLITPFLGQTLVTPAEKAACLKLSFIGFLLGGIFSALFLPIFYLLFVLFSDFYILIFLVLLIILILLVLQEKEWSQRGIAFAILVYSGAIGIFTLKFNFFFKEPLIPCIFGFFALPTILLVMMTKENSSGQKEASIVQEIMSFKEIVYSSFLGTVFSSIIAIVPSLSPGLAMTFASQFTNKSKQNQIVIFSSILSSVLLIYFFLSIQFHKSRIGFISLLQVEKIIPNMTTYDIFLLAFVFLLVVGLTVFLGDYFLEPILKFIQFLDIKKILYFVVCISILIIFWFSGISGIFLLCISCAVGFLPILYNKNRLLLMSYLIIPTILFFI